MPYPGYPESADPAGTGRNWCHERQPALGIGSPWGMAQEGFRDVPGRSTRALGQTRSRPSREANLGPNLASLLMYTCELD